MGIEFDWLAIDPAGGVALLSSAGHGAVPSVVVQHAAQVDDAVESIRTLPVIGEAAQKVRQQEGGDYSKWYAVAARGLYAYDWHLWHGPYERLASPTKPISLDELPASLRSVAQLVEMSVLFSNTTTITVAVLPDPPTDHAPDSRV